MALDYKRNVGRKYALSLKTTGTITKGDAVTIVNYVASRGADGDVFMGVAGHAPEPDTETVVTTKGQSMVMAVKGVVAAGWQQLAVDGAGGIKVGTAGPVYLVLGNDGTNTEVLI